MRRFTLLLCMALVAGPLFSQSIDWLNTWSGKLNEIFDRAMVTGDGHILLQGRFNGSLDLDPGPGTDTYSVPSIYRDFTFFAKLDTNGNYLWGKAFKKPPISDQFRSFDFIDSDAQGNLYLAGGFAGTHDFSFGSTPVYYTSSGDTTRHRSSYIVKLSPSGSLLWFHEYHAVDLTDPFANGPGIAGGLLQNSRLIVHGGYFEETDFDLGPGTALLPDPTPNIQNDVFSFIMELDLNGNFIKVSSMEKVFPQFFRLDGNGQLYMAGTFWDSIDVDISAQTYTLYNEGGADVNMYLMSLDSLLNFRWGHAFGGAGSDLFLDMEVDGPGNVYLIGEYRDTVDFDPGPGQTLLIPSVVGHCILSYSSNGSLNWAGQLDEDTRTTNLILTSSGNALISGFFRDNPDLDPGPGINQPVGLCVGNFCSGSFAVELEQQNGTLVESSFWAYGEDNLYSRFNSFGNVFHVNSNGEKYIVGSWAGLKDLDPSSDSLFQNSFFLTDSAYFDAYLMKIGPSNLVEISEQSFEEQLNIFPNPASDHFTIAWEGNAVADGLLYSSQGKLIDQFKIVDSQTQIDVGYLPAGIYFVEVRSRNGLVRKAIAVQ